MLTIVLYIYIYIYIYIYMDFQGVSVAKHEMQEMIVQSLGGENPLEEEMATHSSILAWRIP